MAPSSSPSAAPGLTEQQPRVSRPRRGRRGPARARALAAGWRTPRWRRPPRGSGDPAPRRPPRAAPDDRTRPRWRRARSAATRADARSSQATAICTRAGSSLARASRFQVSSSSARSMIALAASTRPWARRSRARPACGTAAERLGLAERLLGPVEVAHAAADLAELHEAGGGVHAADPDELGARPDGLLFGSGPLTTTLQGPRPVDPAHAGEEGERVALGPTGRGVGPLGRPAEVAQLLAGADQAAVDLAGRVRTEPALDGGEHGLVEVAQALLGPALVDQQTYPASAGLRPRGRGSAAGVRARSSAVRARPRGRGRPARARPRPPAGRGCRTRCTRRRCRGADEPAAATRRRCSAAP